MANQTLSPAVLDVLNRSTIDRNILVLPPGQLDRALYEAVNKALLCAGGRWKRGKGHVFESDPREKLGIALSSGVVVDEKKQYQAFFTPQEVARRVAELADVSGEFVLEPSAGKGAIVEACALAGARGIYCIELNQVFADSLTADGLENVICGDFLKMEPRRRFARVVMNPPFTRGQDIKHVSHAMKWLSPGGLLAAVMLANKTDDQITDMVPGCSWSVEDVTAGAFRESGTNVATIILSVHKPLTPSA